MPKTRLAAEPLDARVVRVIARLVDQALLCQGAEVGPDPALSDRLHAPAIGHGARIVLDTIRGNAVGDAHTLWAPPHHKLAALIDL